jgi:hypothetical protein
MSVRSKDAEIQIKQIARGLPTACRQVITHIAIKPKALANRQRLIDTASSELAKTKPLSETMDIERMKLDFSMADLSFS